MRIKIKKRDFDLSALDNPSLSCFEPLINYYKSQAAEQTSQFKYDFYQQLTEGQRALFMFYAYYNHVSKSLTEFYWWSAYFFAQPRSWSAIKAGLTYFNDESMLLLLEKIELELKRTNHPDALHNFTITREEFNINKELQTTFKSLYDVFHQTSSLTVGKINDYILKNLQEFVEIVD